MSNQGPAGGPFLCLRADPFICKVSKGIIEAIVGLTLTLLVTVFLVGCVFKTVKNWGWWRLREPGAPEYVRTWHGWIERSKYDRNLKRTKRYKEKFRDLFKYKSTNIDYEWLFWDPTGLKRMEYELQREQTFIRYLPRWMRSWQPQCLPATDVEQGIRVELSSRYDQTRPSVPIVTQMDGPHSCREQTQSYPVMTGALPESCDCPIVHTVRRRKNTIASRPTWHANSQETSRTICTQLLMPRRNRHLCVSKDVPDKTLSSIPERVAQRAVSVPHYSITRPENKRQMRASLSTSTEPLSRMHFALCALEQNKGPEGMRGWPHNTEISTSDDHPKSRIRANSEGSEEPRELALATQRHTILDCNRKLSQKGFGIGSRVRILAMDRILSGAALKDMSNQWKDSKVKAFLSASRYVDGSRHVSMPSFLGIVGRIRSQDSENVPSTRRQESRFASQSKMTQRSHHRRLPRRGELGGLFQIDERQASGDPRPLKRSSCDMLQVENYIRPTNQRVCALTDSAVQRSLQHILWPDRVKVVSTIGSSKVAPEPTLGTEQSVPVRISPAPRQPSQQLPLRLQKKRAPLEHSSGDADTTNGGSFRPGKGTQQAPPVNDVISRPASAMPWQRSFGKTPYALDLGFLRDVHQRLGWLKHELAPGFRKHVSGFPIVLNIMDPQPVSMCETSPTRSTWQSADLRVRPQSRYHKPLEETEYEEIPPNVSLVSASWIARQAPQICPHISTDEVPTYYGCGHDVLGTLVDWQVPHCPTQPVIPGQVKGHDQTKTPFSPKQKLHRSATVSGTSVKKLRRLGKLHVRQHRRITRVEADISHQNPSVSDVGQGQQNVHVARTSTPAIQDEPTASQTPQSDISTLQDVEGSSVSPTLLEDPALPAALTPEDVKDPSRNPLVHDVKESIDDITFQILKEQYDYTQLQHIKVLVRPSPSPHSRHPFGNTLDRKCTLDEISERPLRKFHEPYGSKTRYRRPSSRISGLHLSPSSSDVSVVL